MTSAILSDYNLFNDWLDASSLPVVDSPPGLSSSGSSQSDFYSQHSFERFHDCGADPNFNFRYYTPLELETSFPPYAADPPLLSNLAQLHQYRGFLTSTPGPFVAPSSPNLNASDRLLSPLFRSTSSPAPPGLFDQPRRCALKDITNFFPEVCRPFSPPLPSLPPANNVSPVIRASPPIPVIPSSTFSPHLNAQRTGASFLERIQNAEVENIPSTTSSPERPLAELYQSNVRSPPPRLGSPCPATPRKSLYKIRSPKNPSSTRLLSPLLKSSVPQRTTYLNLDTPQKQPGSATPLTPLTPLSETSRSLSPKLSRKTYLKGKKRLLSQTPPMERRQSSRLRSRPSVTQVSEAVSEASSSDSSDDEEPSVSQGSAEATITEPVFTTREYPPEIEISAEFPLFYRRFPVSSYTEGASNGLRLPGGIYNTPRWPLDLYTPRFVKGKGAEKVGLCPVCVEPPSRGGANKKVWLAMKFSAFNYHMQYAHGISAATGRPFSPPVAFRRVQRSNPGKKEKTEIQEGKCHKCKKWVSVEGIKDVESKVKEIFWWKHAASCHHHSTIEGEDGAYENDEVYQKLIQD